MSVRKLSLRRNQSGVGAVEFALIAPILFTFIIGIAQLGSLYFANAGLKSAVGEGARLATISPRPTREQIISRITDSRFGLDPAKITSLTVSPATLNGRNYYDIRMTYQAELDFVFFETSPVMLAERRLVPVHPL